MKKTVFSLLTVMVLAISCSSGDEKEGGGGSPDQLISASTGWKKVGTIPYTKTNLGVEGYHSMTPYDLAVVGNELALLYSEDYKLTGVEATICYKTKFVPGQTIAAGTKLQRGGFGFSTTSRFVPNTFNPVYMKIANDNPSQIYVCSIATDQEGYLAGNNMGGFVPRSPINWYADGGFTIAIKGQPANGNIVDVVSYTYPNSGNFTAISDQWSLDPTKWIQTDALRLAGGEINEFIVSFKDSKLYFSLIKDDPTYVPTNGVQHDFTMVTRQEIDGLDAAKFRDQATIIASQVVDDKYTVLLGEMENNSLGNTTVAKVYCYQWQKGSLQFTKLYGPIAVPEDIGDNLYSTKTIGSRAGLNGAPVKFTPEGTAYMMYEYFANNTTYTALATMNASGTRMLGKYDLAANPNYVQIGLGICHYFNGAYYAVVYQKNENLFAIDDSKFRMEIVKLEP